jgi:hypothetical protein
MSTRTAIARVALAAGLAAGVVLAGVVPDEVVLNTCND